MNEKIAGRGKNGDRTVDTGLDDNVLSRYLLFQKLTSLCFCGPMTRCKNRIHLNGQTLLVKDLVHVIKSES